MSKFKPGSERRKKKLGAKRKAYRARKREKGDGNEAGALFQRPQAEAVEHTNPDSPWLRKPPVQAVRGNGATGAPTKGKAKC